MLVEEKDSQQRAYQRTDYTPGRIGDRQIDDVQDFGKQEKGKQYSDDGTYSQQSVFIAVGCRQHGISDDLDDDGYRQDHISGSF